MKSQIENSDAIALLKQHGGFDGVRKKEALEGVTVSAMGETVTAITILDYGEGAGVERFHVSAIRLTDGKKCYSGRGATLPEAIANAQWEHFLT
jgi:hypothetical protein